MDSIGSAVLLSAVSVVVTLVVWPAAAIVIGVGARGPARVLGVVGCLVPLLAIGVVLLASRPEVYSAIGLGAIIVGQAISGLFTVVSVVLLCAAAIVASRPRRAPGGLR